MVVNRIRTIDIFRALTMFLMIFVNDLWSLTAVPEWLGHTVAKDDGMGFSDVIFPLFLFIVGLSVPLAINIRIERNQSRAVIIGHILIRTSALLIIGLYMVNYGVINQDAMAMDKNVWQILMALGVFLIWMDYKGVVNLSKGMALGLKIAGILLLIYLAWVFRGGTGENGVWMKIRWWGILGLIGWSYLLNSVVYLFLRKKNTRYLFAVFIFLLFMNVQENAFFEYLPAFKLFISASNFALVMAGTLCTTLYLKFEEQGKNIQFLKLICLMALIFVAYGFLIRPVFPISKILATPSWTALCIGVGFLSYVVLYILVDKMGCYKWARFIKPAGTSTLTCYLMPYFIYPIMVLAGFQWPYFLSDGIFGIGKSLVFSLLIIVFVGMLEKIKIHLKI